MSPQINIYTAAMTPKQKKDLLGIYQDYLYFTQGLELIVKSNSIENLAYMFMKRVGWDVEAIKNLPWHLSWADKKEREGYVRFAQGDAEGSEKYTYISLYHTKTEDDASYPKVRAHPSTHGFTNIDLDLPCVVERYAVAYPKDQKMKDAAFIIDGTFKVKYEGGKFGDLSVFDGLNNEQAQDEFRVLLSLADYYDKHKYEIEYTHAGSSKYITGIMKKIMAAEALSSFENKVLELLGSYSDKTQDILHTFFPNKTSQEVWEKAEKENLISNAETMQQYMNIRQIMRHQWDMLDGTGRFALGGNKKNDELRRKYLQSYHQIFDKTLADRIKAYQKIAIDMQVLLKFIYPEFMTREQGESNSKFVSRLKEWQKQNPTLQPMVNTNYPLRSDKKISLINNLKKVVPQARVLDCMQESDLARFPELERGYFHRAWFLKLYDHLESDMLDYCFTKGEVFNRNEMWNYFKTKVLSPQEYSLWAQYRQLRNTLSHNHLSSEIRETLDKVVHGSFGEDLCKLGDFISNNTPVFVQQEDGTCLARHKDGSMIHINLEERKIISYVDREGRNLLKSSKHNAEISAAAAVSPVKVHWKEKEIIDCTLPNGIYIDLKRKKVRLTHDTHIYLDAKGYNVLRFSNNNKLFTKKNFEIKDYVDQGRSTRIGRHESLFVAPKIRVSTDRRGQLSEVSISLSEKQKLTTQFANDNNSAKIIFPDGTVLKDSAGNMELSHNGIALDYKHRHAFIQSYISPVSGTQNSGSER